MQAANPADIPYVGWQEFLAKHFKWAQGEHVTLVGHTGCGKTTLSNEIMELRGYPVIIGTKPKDSTLDKLAKERGYHVVRKWPPPPVEVHPRIIFWPKVREVSDYGNQREQIRQALHAIFRSGSRAVNFDEVRYITGTLKLQSTLELFWLQGRSLGISVVASTQRPAWIPLEAYSQATHLFLWRDNDDNNLKRLGAISGIDSKLVRRLLPSLPKHEALYLDTRTGKMLRTNVER